MNRVFVYGTLKRGFPNFGAGMQDQRFIGRCRTSDAYPLVIAGRWLTPVMIAEPGAGHRVLGELFRVTDRALAVLDRLEGTHLPDGYHRETIPVEQTRDGAVVEAWVYLKHSDRIDVIHGEPMPEYALDPRYIPPARR